MQRTARGAGFFRLPSRDDGVPPTELFIKASDMHGAFDGDTVRVRMTGRRRGGGSRCGEVVAVLERVKTRFVGRYFERDGRGLVRVDRGLFEEPIEVGDPTARGARPGDQVVLEILHFPDRNRVGEGVVVEVLGARDLPGVDQQTVIHEYGLPGEFSEEVLQEARDVAATFDDEVLGDRQDFTDLTVVTNSLRAAAELAESGPRVILTGGELRRLSQTMVGPLTQAVLGKVRVDKAFMGTLGLCLDDGLTTTDPNEAFTKSLVQEHARQVILLMDSGKAGKVSFAHVGGPECVDVLVSDKKLPNNFAKALRKRGLKVRLA